MKPVLVVVSLVMMVLFNSSAIAEVIEVEYKRFYSHVKKLNSEDTQALQFAFGFQNIHEPRLCKINAAKIVTQKQTIELDVSPEYRFTMPSEKALNLADATVAIELEDQANHCDMSVQLETRPDYLKQYYSNDDLMFIYEQYSAFFNQMGSFLSFMMPQVDGLMVHFDDAELDYDLRDAPRVVNGLLILNTDWLTLKKPVVLPKVPLRITAKTDKST